MATNDCCHSFVCLSLTDKEQKNGSSEKKYANLNLNNLNCSSDVSSRVARSKSCSPFNRKSNNNDYGNDLSDEKDKKALRHKPSAYLNVRDCNGSNNWTKRRNKTNSNVWSSTLSLHIANYENSLENYVASDENAKPEEPRKHFKKFVKNVKKFFGILVETTALEIPRQQPNSTKCKPEIMNFTASKKLCNPNKSGAPKPPPNEYQVLKFNANQLFQTQRYDEAVKAYSDILNFTSLSMEERAVIHCNRSATYLKLLAEKHSLRKAKRDAQKSIELFQTWWKGYYRLAQCHMELEKWPDAKHCLTTALMLIEEQSPEIVKALELVERGLLEDILNYQQRRILYELSNFTDYRNPTPFYTSDSSDDEQEGAEREFLQHTKLSMLSKNFEVKRSPPVDDVIQDSPDGMNKSFDNDISLISDKSVVPKKKAFSFDPESDDDEFVDALDIQYVEDEIDKALSDLENCRLISKIKPSLLSASLLDFEKEVGIHEVEAPSLLSIIDTAGTTNKFNIQLSSSDSSSLGLRCQEIDGKVCIVDVRSGSNAEKAKLEKGDYIIAIDDFIVQGKEMNICANILKENIKNNGFVMMLIERSNRLSTSNETLKSLKDPPQISKESLSHSSPPSNGKRKNHTDYEADPEFSDSSSSHESVTSDDEAEVSEVEESKGTV